MLLPHIALIMSVAQGAGPPPPRGEPPPLEMLAQEVAASLAYPVEPHGTRLDERDRYVTDVTLASYWPRPEFRATLIRILDGDDLEIIPMAARGLLNYRDMTLRLRVEALRTDPRRTGSGRWRQRLGTRISRLLSEFADARGFDPHGAELVTIRAAGRTSFDVPAMTIPRAIAALDDQNLSIRLQAFCWLDRLGLVLDARPLKEAWPRLSDSQRSAVIAAGAEVPRIGADLLKDALDSFLVRRRESRLSDEVVARLTNRLARLGSKAARAVALEIIAEAQSSGDSLDAEGRRLLETAFEAFAASAHVLDVEQALAWSRSTDRRIRFGGLTVLACIDDPRACAEVVSFLESGTTPNALNREPDPVAALCVRSWPDPRFRWHYLRTLSDLLARRTRHRNFMMPVERHTMSDISRTLEAIAKTRPEFVPVPGRRGFSPREAAAAAQQWANWVRQNDPYRGATAE